MVPSSHIHPGASGGKGVDLQGCHHCKGSHGLDPEPESTLGQSPPYHGDICFPLCLEEIWGRKVGEGPAGDPAEAVGSKRDCQHCPEGLLAAIAMVAWLPRAG